VNGQNMKTTLKELYRGSGGRDATPSGLQTFLGTQLRVGAVRQPLG
jgi:hypothetical protein